MERKYRVCNFAEQFRAAKWELRCANSIVLLVVGWCYFHATLLLRCVFYSCDGRCFALSLDSHICVCSLISYKYDREWSSIPFIPHFVGTFHSCTRTAHTASVWWTKNVPLILHLFQHIQKVEFSDSFFALSPEWAIYFSSSHYKQQYSPSLLLLL